MIRAQRISLPQNRVIRQRVGARTIGIHACAVPRQLLDLAPARGPGVEYLRKHHIPQEVLLTAVGGKQQRLSRDAAWVLADQAAADLEARLLSGRAGRLAARFSTAGQGIYADYGRPTLDFSGFFVDHLNQEVAAAAGRLAGSLRVGPAVIALDCLGAAGLTALGHWARGADLTDRGVAIDLGSTGIYEGGSAWVSAKLGVAVGAKAMGLTALLPVPGARVAALLVGFAVGAATAIAAKRAVNGLKDRSIDAVCARACAPEQGAGNERIAACPSTEMSSSRSGQCAGVPDQGQSAAVAARFALTGFEDT